MKCAWTLKCLLLNTNKCSICSERQSYLLLPSHPHMGSSLPQCHRNIPSEGHNRTCPDGSFHRCPPYTTRSPTHQSNLWKFKPEDDQTYFQVQHFLFGTVLSSLELQDRGRPKSSVSPHVHHVWSQNLIKMLKGVIQGSYIFPACLL